MKIRELSKGYGCEEAEKWKQEKVATVGVVIYDIC